MAILKMQTASETAHSTNRLSLIKTRARTACRIPPSLQTRKRDRESDESLHSVTTKKKNGMVSSTLAIQSASELPAPTKRRLGSPPGKIHSDSGKTISEEAWNEKQGTAASNLGELFSSRRVWPEKQTISAFFLADLKI